MRQALLAPKPLDSFTASVYHLFVTCARPDFVAMVTLHTARTRRHPLFFASACVKTGMSSFKEREKGNLSLIYSIAIFYTFRVPHRRASSLGCRRHSSHRPSAHLFQLRERFLYAYVPPCQFPSLTLIEKLHQIIRHLTLPLFTILLLFLDYIT